MVNTDDGYDLLLSNKEKLAIEIAKIKSQHDMTTLEAIVLFCEVNECDILDIVPAISRTLREEIYEDAVKNRLILEDTKVSKLL